MKKTTCQQENLRIEDCSLEELAVRYGTPLYVYSEAQLRRALQELREAFTPLDPLFRYSCKTNANIHLLEIIGAAGVGADVISAGELALARRAGIPPESIIMEGPGKSEAEIATALAEGVSFFSVESPAELVSLRAAARRAGCRAVALLRLNPDIAAGDHHYINTARKENKFGMTEDEVSRLLGEEADDDHLCLGGLHLHLGSQITDPAPFREAVERARRLHRVRPFAYLDLGGGFPIAYREPVPALPVFAAALREALDGFAVRLMLEPGRFVVGPAGGLLTRVLYRKERPHRNFLVVDAAMNDLLRPALYEAWHEITPVRVSAGPTLPFDVVGPVCESGDFLARERPLPADARPGDLLLVGQAGAYGYVMSSNYNGRLRPAEVLVSGARARLIRRRETIADLAAASEGL